MKKDYTLRLLLTIAIAIFLKVFLFAAGKGYLITKDDKYITGEVVAVNYTLSDSELVFMNDFGDLYQIHPYLIKGFVYREKEETVEYESKFNGKNWLFFKLEVGGRGIRMYQMNSVVTAKNLDSSSIVETQVSKEFWLEKEGEKPFKIYRIGFRPAMRKLTSDFPELSNLIGEKGYRYKNLKTILVEYNKWYEDTRIML